MPNDKYLWNPEKLDTEFKPLPGAESTEKITTLYWPDGTPITFTGLEESGLDIRLDPTPAKNVRYFDNTPRKPSKRTLKWLENR